MNIETKSIVIEERAGYLFENGFHCAEAVVTAYLESKNHDTSAAVSHATAFGGGFGRTFEEACGALSGGLIVIGHLYGRKMPGQSWDIPAEYAADLRERFIKAYGTTHCKTLRDRFGEEQPWECCKLVIDVTKDLIEVLSKSCQGNLEKC